MALGQEDLRSLGLEIAKRKYYNAAKVESVIEDFSRRAAALNEQNAALSEENAALRLRAESLACGREEIGDAILSAKMISQQIINEAKEQAEAILASARERAAALLAEAEERVCEKEAACERREQRTVRAAEECYLQLREQYLGAVQLLDGEWQRFLCALGDEEGKDEPLPDDLADRLGELAACLEEIGGDGAESEEKRAEEEPEGI